MNTKEKAKVKCLCKEAEKIKNNIAKERDRLRELIGEIEDIIDSTDSFISDFEHALDSLSQYL